MDNFFVNIWRRERDLHTPPPPPPADETPQEQRAGNYGKRIQPVRGQRAALSVAAFYRAVKSEVARAAGKVSCLVTPPYVGPVIGC